MAAPKPEFLQYMQNLESLATALVAHPAMQQTPSVTPQPPNAPAPKNKILWMYDFVARTRDNLQKLDPSVPPDQNGEYMDCVGRGMLTNILINQDPGQLSMLTGEQPGEEVDFGDDIRRKTQELVPTQASQSTGLANANS